MQYYCNYVLKKVAVNLFITVVLLDIQQFPKQYHGCFFIQWLVIVTAFWRLDATGTAFLTGAFFNNF